MSSERSTDGTERTLKADKRNGVYILTIQKSYHGYVVMSDHGQQAVESVTIHGKYIGIDERAEIECDGFEIRDDTLHLRYNDAETDRSEVDRE